MKKAIAAFVLGAALITTVVGCGGGSASGSKAAAAPTGAKS